MVMSPPAGGPTARCLGCDAFCAATVNGSATMARTAIRRADARRLLMEASEMLGIFSPLGRSRFPDKPKADRSNPVPFGVATAASAVVAFRRRSGCRDTLRMIMAGVMRSRVDPYKNFKFRVSLGDTVVGGFDEVGAVTKIKGLNKSADVTLKRGVIGAAALRDWLKQVRKRTVTIELQSEGQTVTARWVLGGARLVKYTAEPLEAKGNDVAVEELVLSAERLELISRAK